MLPTTTDTVVISVNSDTFPVITSFNGLHCFQDTDGSLYYDTEDVAEKLGFVSITGYSTTTVNSSTTTVSILQTRWDRMNGYLLSINLPELTAEEQEGYIKEDTVYKLGYRGKTDKALKLQNLVSNTILPYYRHTDYEGVTSELNIAAATIQSLTNELASKTALLEAYDDMFQLSSSETMNFQSFIRSTILEYYQQKISKDISSELSIAQSTIESLNNQIDQQNLLLTAYDDVFKFTLGNIGKVNTVFDAFNINPSGYENLTVEQLVADAQFIYGTDTASGTTTVDTSVTLSTT